jgi:hypothetical protein
MAGPRWVPARLSSRNYRDDKSEFIAELAVAFRPALID